MRAREVRWPGAVRARTRKMICAQTNTGVVRGCARARARACARAGRVLGACWASRTGHGVVLGVVLELLGRYGRAEEVHQVLENIVLGGRKGARLWVGVEC